MEELVSLAKEEAERANGAKSDFLASMSHELKSPVAQRPRGRQAHRDGRPRARAQGRLDHRERPGPPRHARRHPGLRPLRDRHGLPPEVRLPARQASWRGSAMPRARRPRPRASPSRSGPIPDETLRSDPDRLGRAFAAILDNAVSFTERGKVRVDAAIEQSARATCPTSSCRSPTRGRASCPRTRAGSSRPSSS